MRGRGLIVCFSRCPRIKPNLLWSRRGYWQRKEKGEEESTTVTKGNSPELIIRHENAAAGFATTDAPSNVQCASQKITTTAKTYNDAVPKRIVFGSCSSQTLDLSYWERILAIAPDLVILMGDNVYGKEEGGVERAYEQWKCHPSYSRMASSAIPIVATLDDNDYCHSEGGTMDAAKNAFLQFFQIPKSDDRWKPNRGVYTSYLWTDQLQVILLDVRYSKSPFLEMTGSVESGAGSPQYIPDSDPSKTMLGAEQWQWLEQQIQVPVKLRLMVSPIQVLAEGHSFDCWNLFPRERERLLALLSAAADDTQTILLSGDRHVAGFYQKDGWHEITSSSLTHSVPFGLLDHEVDPTRIGGLVYVNNFGLAEVDWDNNNNNNNNKKNVLVQVSIRRADTGDLVGTEWMRKI